MALDYVGSEEIDADHLGSVILELDRALTILFSGKSPLAFGFGSGLVLGLQFRFGDPAKRKIQSASAPAYDHGRFAILLAALNATDTNLSTGIVKLSDPTVDEYDTIGEMFGISAFQSACAAEAVWPFDFSLEFHRVTVGDVKCRLEHDGGYDPRFPASREQFHDRAVAEIVIEGWDGATFLWPAEWGKFGCLRFHNLDNKPIGIVFQGLETTVTIPPLCCRTVRQGGFDDGRRTSVAQELNYLWPLMPGDAPIYNAYKEQRAGVWGAQGFSSLCSVPILHAWLDLGLNLEATGLDRRGFSFDPRVKWDSGTLYDESIGSRADTDPLIRYTLQGAGDYVSMVKDPDTGEWSRAVKSLRWLGAKLVGDDVNVDLLATEITSRAADGHDIIPLSTGVFGEAVLNLKPGPFILSRGPTGEVARRRLVESIAPLTARYRDNENRNIVYDVETSLQVAGFTDSEMFGYTLAELGEIKGLKNPAEATPDTEIDSFSERQLLFDGRTLVIAFQQTSKIDTFFAVPFGTETSATSLGAWDVGDTELFQNVGATIATLQENIDQSPARLFRYISAAPGYLASGVWVFTRHPHFIAQSTGADFEWEAPVVEESELRIVAPIGNDVATKSGLLRRRNSNIIRAIKESNDTERWGEKREALIAGTLETEDKAGLWWMPGAREHANWLIARINALVGIEPLQLQDLLYYGNRLFSDTLKLSAFLPPRFAARLDTSSEAVQAAAYLGLSPRTSHGMTWLSIDDMTYAAESIGVYYHSIRRFIPFQEATEGDPSSIYQTGAAGHAWVSAPSEAVHGISVWVNPLPEWALPDGTQDAIDAYQPPGVGHAATMRRAIVIEVATYAPDYGGWEWNNLSRLMCHPMPMLRYENDIETDIPELVPIVPEIAPPVTPRNFLVTEILENSPGGFIDTMELRDAFHRAGIGEEDWQKRTMVYVQFLRRSGYFRAE